MPGRVAVAVEMSRRVFGMVVAAGVVVGTEEAGVTGSDVILMGAEVAIGCALGMILRDTRRGEHGPLTKPLPGTLVMHPLWVLMQV